MAEPNKDDQFYADERPRPAPVARETVPAEELEPLPALGRRGRGEKEAAPRLGSLAQSARGNQVGQARGILLAIGILTVLVNAGIMFVIRDQVMGELRKQGVNNVPPAQLQPILWMAYAIQGGFVFLGALFIVLGILVKRFPLPCTVAGLVIYLLGMAISAVLDPTSLAAGLIIKIIVIVALIKAIQAAITYEHQRRQERDLGEVGD